MTKPLNIGMIGYGFMGRVHSNAYCQVGNFFDLEYRPVLKAVWLPIRVVSRPRRSRLAMLLRASPSWSKGYLTPKSS